MYYIIIKYHIQYRLLLYSSILHEQRVNNECFKMMDHKGKIVNIKAPSYARRDYFNYNRTQFIVCGLYHFDV